MTSRTPFNGKGCVSVNRAILMGKHVICDGYHPQRHVAVFTHIHDDHIKGFESALGWCDVYVSKPTRELLLVMRREDMSLDYRSNFFGQDYEVPFSYEDEKITLFPVKHILGSCQVLVENGDGVRILYTSDFDMPGTKPVECDVLIIDATHGSQEYVSNYERGKILNDFINTVDNELRNNRPVVIKAHRGQLQEIMGVLSGNLQSSAPFLTTKKERSIADVYRNYGYMIKEEILDVESHEARQMIANRNPYVRFSLWTETLEEGAEDVAHIKLGSNIAFRGAEHAPWYKIGNRYSFDLSNHADFNGILDYVRECKPKLVITDSSRSYYATNLVKEIQSKFNINAIAMPDYKT